MRQPIDANAAQLLIFFFAFFLRGRVDIGQVIQDHPRGSNVKRKREAGVGIPIGEIQREEEEAVASIVLQIYN